MVQIDIDLILTNYPITLSLHKRMEGYGSHNYLVTDDQDKRYVLKYYSDVNELPYIRSENDFLLQLANHITGNDTPLPIQISGDYIVYHDIGFSRLLTYIHGDFMGDLDWNDALITSLGYKTGLLMIASLSVRSNNFPNPQNRWDLQYALLNKEDISTINGSNNQKLVKYHFDHFEQFTLPLMSNCPKQNIHGDINEWNVLCKGKEVTGFIDFGDMSYGPRINELAIPLAYIMMGCSDPIHSAKCFIDAVSQHINFTAEEIDILPSLIITRACVSVINSSKSKSEQSNTDYISINEKQAWALIHKWHSWNPIYLQNEFRKSAGLSTVNLNPVKNYTEEKRKALMAPSLSLSYKQPIHMESAAFQYMYDKSGNAYLDAYNNIPHIGHAHPLISEAVSRQVRKLYTNSRYYNEIPLQYAESLLKYFPAELDTIFYVNSGTEANDLASRLAHTYTNNKGRIALEMGYHGHSPECIDFSPYKYNGLGGEGPKDHILELPLPKIYLGSQPDGETYAIEAIQMIADSIANGHQYSSIIVETISGCGGQVPLAPSYLKKVFKYCEDHNILTISDEVQVGFGRLGEYFWGFEMHDVIPDIVVLGKPMGNGLPIAAVITKKHIAETFDNGMEFFSSFAGNQVSIAAAQAVLTSIEQEGLQSNAKKMGSYFKNQLCDLQSIYPMIGDVRGQGFFLGIEFLPHNQMSASQISKLIKNRMKEKYILTSTDGKNDEVIKIKGPLCFTIDNVDLFCDRLTQILKTL